MKPPPSPSGDADGEIAALVETLLATEQRLVHLTAGEVDSVAGKDGRAFLLQRAQEQLRRHEAEKQAAILNALPAHIALLNAQGIIVSVNDAWRRFGLENGFDSADSGVGLNYPEICGNATGLYMAEAHRVATGIRDVLAGREKSFSIEYPCHSPKEQRWFILTVTPLTPDATQGAVVMHVNITSRKQGETASTRLAALVESSQDAIIGKNLQSVIVSWNSGAEKIFGYTASEMIGTSILRLNPDDRPDEHLHLMARIRRGENIGHFETVRQTKDGRLIDISVTASPMKDGAGKMIGVSIVARDITARRQAEKALHASQASLAAAQQIAHFGSWELDLDNTADIDVNPLRWSDEMFRIAGLEPGSVEITSELFFSLVPPAEHQAIREAVATAISKRQQYAISHRFILPDGEERLILETAQIFFDENTGRPLKIVGTAHDITELKRAEIALQSSEARFRSMLQGIEAGVIVRNSDLQITAFNPKAAELLGVNGIELNAYTLCGPQWRRLRADGAPFPDADLPHRQAHSSREPVRDTIVGVHRPAPGDLIWLLVNANPTLNLRGEVEEIITTLVDVTARIQVEQALQRQQNELQVLFDLIPAMIWFKDTENRILRVNQKVAVAARKSVGEIEGRPSLEIYPHEAAKHYADDLELIRSGQSKLGIVEVMLDSAGHESWVETDKVPVRDKEGKVIGIFVMTQDITERKRLDENIRRLAAIVEYSADAIISTTVQGDIASWNPAAEKMFGYSADEIVGRSKHLLIPPDYVDEDREILASLSQGGQVRRIETIRRRKNGEIFNVSTTISRIHDAQGNIVGVSRIVRDITERKQAEAALRALALKTERRERMLTTMLSAGSDFACIYDREGRFLFANEPMLQLWGLTSDKVVGRNHHEIGYPDFLARRLDEEVETVFATSRSVTGEMSHASPDRRTGSYEYIFSPAFAADGTVDFVVANTRDITARKNAEVSRQEVLEQTTREQLRFKFIVDSVPVGISWMIVGRLDTRIVNPAHALITGVPQMHCREIERYRDATHPEERSAQDELHQKLESGAIDSYTVVKRYVHPDTTTRWVELTVRDFRGGINDEIQEVSTVVDITAQRQMEQALRVSEEHFRFLNGLADATRTLMGAPQILAVTARILAVHLGASRCAYADVEPNGDQFTIRHDYTDGCASTVGQYQLSLFGPKAVTTLNRGQSLVIRNVDQELLPNEGADMFNAIGIKAIITCPLVKEGILRAMIAVHQTTPRDWQPQDVALAQEVVERCWSQIERRTAEERLRQSETLLRIAGRAARLGGWSVELPATRVIWSEEVCSIHDVPKGTIPGLEQAIGFYTPSSRIAISEAFAVCLQAGTPFNLELDLISAKGRRVRVRAIGEAQRNDAGTVIRVQGAFQDISEHRQALDALQVSEQRFKALFEQAAVGVAQIDATTGQFVQVNRRYCEITGRSLQELEQTTLIAITHPSTADGDVEAMRQLKVGEIREFTREKRFVRGDRSEVWVNLTVSAMWAVGEAADYFVAIAQDITGQKLLEEQFRQAQKMEAIGTLAGGIAHDFNNVLAAVNGYTELAKREVSGNEIVTGYLDSVLTGARRATDLVRQILAFSRQQALERKPIQLREVVGEALALLRATIPTTIGFETSLSVAMPNVLADASQIHQVVMNLCTNAAQAMKDRLGRLTVKLEEFRVDSTLASTRPGLSAGLYVRLSVSDTGSGMDEATQRRIFEPFFTTKAPGEGTGLGLAVVHGIMQSHDGAVTVYSHVGEGTTFHLYFPAHNRGLIEAAAKVTSSPFGTGERILYVDDEQPLALMGKRILEHLGYVVAVHTNPADALAAVSAKPDAYDLVVTDQMMPGMTGVSLAEKIHAIRTDLPIILTTGYSATLTNERVQAMGIRKLLLKPLTFDALGAAVYQVLIEAKPPDPCP